MYSQELQTQLNLRGTEHEHLDSKLDQILQEISKLTIAGQNASIGDRLKQLESTVANIVKSQEKQQRETTALVEKLKALDITSDERGTNGAVYTRWGRTTCPGNGTHMVYSGYAAGDHYNHKGGAPDMLCLPKDPEWGKYDESKNRVGGYLYGVEYEMDQGRDKTMFGKSMYQNDVPCVVCEVKRRPRKLMIPGKITCYDGWTREYWGYLMSSHYDHVKQSNHYCVDADPASLPGGHENQNGYLLYFVEIRCGAFRCPPYILGRELPCVVCTK